MNTTQPTSAARAAALLLALVPELARVELYPQWSDGTGVVVRRTRAVPYGAAGNVIELPGVQQRAVSAVLRRIGDIDPNRPQSLDVATGEVSPVFELPVPLWLSPVSEPYAPVGAVAERLLAGALLEQRHQLEDPAEPPLAVAVDCARSLRDGHMEPVDWDDDAPARPVVTVPVVGGAL